MVTGILGLGSSGSTNLNQELIDKLKNAEEKAYVKPIETKIENLEAEKTAFDIIEEKALNLKNSVKSFSLSGSLDNIFDLKTASATGTSASFSVYDISSLESGTYTIDIQQLPQKDVFQTNLIYDTSSLITNGQDSGDQISITVKGNTFDFSTEGKTYEELVDEINLNEDITASLEQVNDNDYRLIIKSTNVGTENSISINETGTNFGITQQLTAQNLIADVDGIEYNVSSQNISLNNSIDVLALETGKSSVSFYNDNDSVLSGIDSIVNAYNELVDTVSKYTDSKNTTLQDSSSIKMILDQAKSIMLSESGPNDESIFSYGFELDTDGKLSYDEAILNKTLNDNPEKLKNLFIGTAEDKGIGEHLFETFAAFSFNGGLLNSFEESITNRKTTYQANLEKQQEKLDDKYTAMSEQFASYTAIITQMESSFSGLLMMMKQSTASN